MSVCVVLVGGDTGDDMGAAGGCIVFAVFTGGEQSARAGARARYEAICAVRAR